MVPRSKIYHTETRMIGFRDLGNGIKYKEYFNGNKICHIYHHNGKKDKYTEKANGIYELHHTTFYSDNAYVLNLIENHKYTKEYLRFFKVNVYSCKVEIDYKTNQFVKRYYKQNESHHLSCIKTITYGPKN